MNFIDKYFDKLLLTFLLGVAAALTIFLAGKGDKDLTQWTLRSFDFILGSLTAIITGRIVGTKPEGKEATDGRDKQ